MTRRVPSLAQRRKKPEPDLEDKEVDVLFGDSKSRFELVVKPGH